MPNMDNKQSCFQFFLVFGCSDFEFVLLPVIFARVLLDQLKAIFFSEKHESIHRPLGLVSWIFLLLFGRRRRGRHLRRDWNKSGHGSGQRWEGIVGGKFEPPESIAEIRSSYGFRMIWRQTDVPHWKFLAWDSVFVNRHPRMRWTPSWKERKNIYNMGFLWLLL